MAQFSPGYLQRNPQSNRIRELEEIRRENLARSQRMGEEAASHEKAMGNINAGIITGAVDSFGKGMKMRQDKALSEENIANAQQSRQKNAQAMASADQERQWLAEEIEPGVTRQDRAWQEQYIDAPERKRRLDEADIASKTGKVDETKWATQTDDYGNVYRVDAKTGKVEKIGKVNKAPPASATANDTQFKAATFARRLEQAEQVFSNLEKAGYDRTQLREGAENMLYEGWKSGDLKQQNQAELNFISAILRRESGASISPTELENGQRQYFPREGDTPQVVANKKANRKQALAALRAESGPAYASVPFVPIESVPKKPEQGTATAAPDGGTPGMVKMKAPDGSVMQVPAMSVKKYEAKGAKVVQ